ncbi:MAG TPA: ABC transporter permease [Candidatus Mediterraneibacter norfolkensis]|nr:ABC transporter permease [Candidatus Mediterraneibacter norfolkensis]
MDKVIKAKDTLSKFIMVIAFVLIVLIFSVLSDRFLTLDNFFNVLRQVSTNGIIAMGMTLVIIAGGIDLSVGSVFAFAGTLCCGLIEGGMHFSLAILIALAASAVFGVINGVLIAKVNMPPFIVTLATMQMIRGAAYIYSHGSPIRAIDNSFNMLGNGYVSVVPVPVIIFFIVTLIAYLILHRSKLGMYIYAVGGNKNCAVFSGIKTKQVEIKVYVICALCAAMSGIIMASRMYSGQPTSGDGIEMDAIAATVLGGASFSGGAGKISGTVLGILIIGVMTNGLNILNVDSYYQYVLKGLIILFAIYVDMIKKK